MRTIFAVILLGTATTAGAAEPPRPTVEALRAAGRDGEAARWEARLAA